MKNYNITKGLYIPNIEATWIYKENLETGNYEVEQEHLNKLLAGKLDYSFELVASKALLDNVEIKEYDGKLYTLDVVNVKYNNTYKNEDKSKARDTKQLRDWSYGSGFNFNGKKLSNWKRSTGKARKGENLFLIDNIVGECLDWARMGLKFTGDVDIASIRSYESLPLSSIIGTIEIDPQSILVIDDYDSIFPWAMSKTELKDGNLVTTLETVQESNSIWDGQSLLDKSIYDSHTLIEGKGYALLRNRFMKSASFSVNIEQFYRDYCSKNNLDYNTYSVKDIANNEILVKEIKMITTPNSIKICKFSKQVREVDGYDYDNSWLNYWLDNCGSTFGVCEVDKPSRMNNGLSHRLSYQMVNTIPFTREELSELASEDIAKIERLKNDLDFFITEAKIDKQDQVDIDDDEDSDIEVGENMDIIGGFAEMVRVNSDFANTQVFKDYRRNYIASKVTDLRKGRIEVEGDYHTIIGNPVEMLFATVNEFTGQSLTLKDNETHCTRFADGEELVGFRSPHICTGNIANLINVCRDSNDDDEEKDLITKYVNATDNISITNNILYPLQTLLQGQDMDGDSYLLTNNSIVVNACKRVDHSVTPIPVNAIQSTGKNNTELTGANMSDIDHVISQNFIGRDVNLSQEVISTLNHKIYNSEISDKDRDELYERVSKASSISCVEIDKAKKQFADLNVTRELENMKEGMKIVSETDNRRVKPAFFKHIGDSKSKRMKALTNRKHREELDNDTIIRFALAKGIGVKDVNMKDKELIKEIKNNSKVQTLWEELEFESMDTPMDWLNEDVDNMSNAKRSKTVQVISLVKRNRNKANIKVVDAVAKLIIDADEEIKGYRADREIDYIDRRNKIDRAKQSVVRKVRDMKLSKANLYGTMKEMLTQVKNNGRIGKKSSLENITLQILFMAYGSGLLSMFIADKK